MKFSNAYDGIKKLFTAEILEILAALAGIVALALGAFAYGADQTSHADIATDTAAIAAIVGIAAAGLLLAAAIINFIGLNRAAKDEPLFKNAVTAVIISAALAIVDVIIPESAKAIHSIISAASSIIGVYVYYTVVQGICSLAGKLGNTDIIENGKTVTTLILISAGLSVVSDAVQAFLIKDPKANLNVILGIAGLIFGLVKDVAYIIYLGKAKKMLKNA